MSHASTFEKNKSTYVIIKMFKFYSWLYYFYHIKCNFQTMQKSGSLVFQNFSQGKVIDFSNFEKNKNIFPLVSFSKLLKGPGEN